MSTKKIHHPHDMLAKAMLMNKEVATDYIKANIPANIVSLIDFESMLLTNKSFVDDRMKEIHADVIYKVTCQNEEAYIMLLLEQQATPDNLMAFRLLEYAVNGMRQHIAETGSNKLPIILPICLYHGKEKPYPYSTDIFECFSSPEIAEKCLSRHFNLVDLTMMTDEDFEKQKTAYMLCAMLKHVHTRNYALEIEKLFEIGKFSELLNKVDTNTAKHVLKYIHQSIDDLDLINPGDFLAKLLEATPDDKKELTMTLADYLRKEGMKAKHSEAMEVAAQDATKAAQKETKQSLAKNMLLEGINPDTIQRVTDLSIDDIDNIKKSINH